MKLTIFSKFEEEINLQGLDFRDMGRSVNDMRNGFMQKIVVSKELPQRLTNSQSSVKSRH
jgi:hypothetical protein